MNQRLEQDREGAASPGRSSLIAPGSVQRQELGSTSPGKQTLVAQLPDGADVVQRTAGPSAHRTLSVGSTGPEVQLAQRSLNQRGATPPVAEDGHFGPRTRSAVIAFQAANQLAADGIIGAHTWAALDASGGARPAAVAGDAGRGDDVIASSALAGSSPASASSSAAPAPANASLVPVSTASLAPAGDLASAAPSSGSAAPSGTAGSWDTVVPRLHAKNAAKHQRDKDIAKVTNTAGQAPTVSYDMNASEKTGGGNDADVDAAVQSVIAARGAIPQRDVGRDPFTKKGNYYNPDRDKSGAADDYEAWRKSARPTASFIPGDAKDERKWQIFTRMWNLEGNPGTVTTFDKTLTIGAGFSSAGTQAERVLGYALDRLPEIKAAAFAAGLTLQNASMDVVDTNQKVVVSGFAAAAYVQTVPELISFISNIIIGAQTDAGGAAPQADSPDRQRQMMLDGQWVAFSGAALSGIPDDMLSWDLSAVTLAVHARHALQATFPWDFLRSNGPGLESLVRAIYKRLKANNMSGWFHAIVNGEYGALAKKIESERPATDKEIQEAGQNAVNIGLAWSMEHLFDDGIGSSDGGDT